MAYRKRRRMGRRGGRRSVKFKRGGMKRVRPVRIGYRR